MNVQAYQQVLLLPIGALPEGLLNWLKVELREIISQPVAIGEQSPPPEHAFDVRRNQYLGDSVLEFLAGYKAPAGSRIVGLIDADCYAPGLNFIFGQAAVNGREALVALPRLRNRYYGLPEDPAVFHRRVLKEVVHELGHTWGLRHCPDPHCVMHFSNSLRDTDLKQPYFCTSCQPLAG